MVMNKYTPGRTNDAVQETQDFQLRHVAPSWGPLDLLATMMGCE